MKFKLRIFVVVGSLALCLLFLKDTFDWYFVIPEIKKDLISLNNDEIDKLPEKKKKEVMALKKKRKKVINLGLDLQGGLYLVLGVNEELLKSHLKNIYKTDLMTRKYKGKLDKISPAQLDKEVADLVKKNFEKEKESACLSAFNRIGNRVDQFGISEPEIVLGNDNRIYISLAGVKDPQAAEEIVSRAGKLTFQLYDGKTQNRFVNKYAVKRPKLFANFGTKRAAEWRIANEAKIPKNFKVPLDSKLYYFWKKDVFGIPKKKGGVFIKTKVLLDGKHIRFARPDMNQLDNSMNVSFTLDGEGASIFSKVTGENIGKLMAIILDGKIKTYPRIQGKIPGGSGQITGNFTQAEAKNLSAILNAGSFNVGLKIEEKRSIGPSIGKDSVKAGINAVMIGFILVVAFMMIYYKFMGFVADIALLFNFVLVLAVMSQFGLTLTLPGIAGLILTLGMSVDANVIIFERIKEEISEGRSQLRVSIAKGFGRAFRTILDANITTLVAALVLMQLGTGSIKGFAVTLFIGILSSMYTALFVSRLLIDGTVSVFKLKKIYI